MITKNEIEELLHSTETYRVERTMTALSIFRNRYCFSQRARAPKKTPGTRCYPSHWPGQRWTQENNSTIVCEEKIPLQKSNRSKQENIVERKKNKIWRYPNLKISFIRSFNSRTSSTAMANRTKERRPAINSKTKKGSGLLPSHDTCQLWRPLCPDRNWRATIAAGQSHYTMVYHRNHVFVGI